MTSVELQNHTPRPWADIPPDLLLPIAERLDITTAIRLSAVRTSWVPQILPCFPSIPSFRPDQPIPWLLISPQKSETDSNNTDFTFYDLVTAASYSIPVPIPSLYNHQWWGSNKGWILTVDPQSQLHLIKPLTGAHVLLPSNGIGRERHSKVILCRTPDCTNGYLAISINNQGQLVAAKAGVDGWILMSNNYAVDAILYKGKVYTISFGGVSCWDILGSSFRKEWFISTINYRKIHWWTKFLEMWKQMWRLSSRHFFAWSRYLVEWRGELLLVFTNKDSSTRLDNCAYCKVKLYKFNFKDIRNRPWRRVWSLGNDALFIGANYSYAVSTRGVDNVCGNCVYFTDQLYNYFCHFKIFQSKCAFGVYDVKKKTYKRCYLANSPLYSMPPIWFWPC